MKENFPNEIMEAILHWEPMEDRPYHFFVIWEKNEYIIRLNDFPAEALCTLCVGDVCFDIDDWPEGWTLPKHRSV